MFSRRSRLSLSFRCVTYRLLGTKRKPLLTHWFQSMARQASKLIDQHLDMEGLDFGILIGAAAAYVLSAWWIIAVRRFHMW